MSLLCTEHKEHTLAQSTQRSQTTRESVIERESNSEGFEEERDDGVDEFHSCHVLEGQLVVADVEAQEDAALEQVQHEPQEEGLHRRRAEEQRDQGVYQRCRNQHENLKARSL